MYDTILVPLDGSLRAEAILSYVKSLALKFGSRLVLLRVVDPVTSVVGLEGMPVDVTRDLINQETEEAKRYLEHRRSSLSSEGINVQIEVRFGPIVQAIIEVADSQNADLIAIASHGRTGLARIFYGSVAAGVLHHADRPLLIIRSLGD